MTNLRDTRYALFSLKALHRKGGRDMRSLDYPKARVMLAAKGIDNLHNDEPNRFSVVYNGSWKVSGQSIVWWEVVSKEIIKVEKADNLQSVSSQQPIEKQKKIAFGRTLSHVPDTSYGSSNSTSLISLFNGMGM